MTCGCNKNNKDIEVIDLHDVPVDTNPVLPDFLLTERLVEDPQSGDYTSVLSRTPVKSLLPTGRTDNIFAIPANNPDLDLANYKVAAGTVKNFGSYYATIFADDENPALFLIIGATEEASGIQVLAQNCGVITIPTGHDFIPLAQYYTSADGSGLPVTDSATGQKLFIPLSRTQLLVNLGQ